MTADEIYKSYPHNPPHLFRPGAKYFITGATYGHVGYMKTAEAKDLFIHYLMTSFNHFNWEIEDWVVLDNHYHLMANAPKDVNTLSDMMNNFHRFSAIGIRKILNKESMECTDCVSACTDIIGTLHTGNTKIFHNYWDSCINYENSWYARLHYIWNNPVKHGCVSHPSEWKWGSFFQRWLEDRERLLEIMSHYPCDRVNVWDDF